MGSGFAVNKGSSDVVPSIAEENLTIGWPVGVSSKSTIARANRTQLTSAHSIAATVSTPGTAGFGGSNVFAPINTDKFVVLIRNSAASDTLFAQVVTIDNATKNQTVGTAVTVATAFTPAASVGPNYCVCQLDTDKFIAFYLLDASTTVIKYRVGTVAGDVITFGSEATAATAASTVATSGAFAAAQIATDKGVFVFKAATTTDSKIIAFTTSGTVATFGSAVSLGTNTAANQATAVTKIGTDKCVVICHNAASSLYGQVCTLSGTVVTAGSEVQLSTTAGSLTNAAVLLSLASGATDAFVAVFGNSGTANNYVACSVSGTVITAGTTLAIPATGSVTAGGLYAADASTFYGPIGLTSANIRKITKSGNVLTDAGSTMVGLGSSASFQVVPLTGYFVATFWDTTNFTTFIDGMAANFLGFVQNTVARGGNATVQTQGVDSNQSGLAPGVHYQATNGALVAANSTSNANTPVIAIVAKALTATSVQITC